MTKVVSQTVHVNGAGGPVTVLMTAGNAAPGHYTLALLEHDAFTVVKDFGIVKFGSPASNTHALPGSAAENDGRFLQAVTSVGIVDANRDYAVFLDVIQDGQKVGTISDHGPDTSGTADTIESELDGALSATPAVALTASAAKLLAPKPAARKTATTKRAKTTRSLQSLTRKLVSALKTRAAT